MAIMILLTQCGVNAKVKIVNLSLAGYPNYRVETLNQVTGYNILSKMRLNNLYLTMS
jgi:hypothetical protein